MRELSSQCWSLKVVALVVLFSAQPLLAATGMTYRYIQQMLTGDAKTALDFVRVANMVHFRTIFPHIFALPNREEFLSQAKDAGISEQQAAFGYISSLERGKDLSAAELITVLMREDTYRAHVFAYIILLNMQSGKGNLSQQEMARIAGTSRLIVPLVMAIDGDYTQSELFKNVTDLLTHQFTVNYRHQRDPPLPSHQIFHGHIGRYLFREHHQHHGKLNVELTKALQQRGYRDSHLQNLLSPSLAWHLSQLDHQPLAVDSATHRIGDLDAALIVDLLSEGGIVKPEVVDPLHLLDINQQLQKNVKQLLLYEMLGDRNAEDFLQEVVDLLNAPREAASLFQIVQLLRLGFSFDDIKALSYWAREAIIVSNHASKESFTGSVILTLDTFGFSAAAVNGVVADVGPLVFMLERWGYELDQINRHSIDTLDGFF